MDRQQKLKVAYEALRLKFQSGNDVPVERATMSREEWESIAPLLKKFASDDIVLPFTMKRF